MNSAPTTFDVLVAGGDADPNLSSLLRRLEQRGVSHRALLVGRDHHPRVTWRLEAPPASVLPGSGDLFIDGEAVRPRAMFLRHDVFTSLAERRPEPAQRALAWFNTLYGWILAHPEVALINRASALSVTNKPHVLWLARSLGLDIPRTWISNDRDDLLRLQEAASHIAKPVNGGDYTRRLSQILPSAPHRDGALPGPAIIQEELVPPEIRLYRVGPQLLAFRLVADALDYRTDSKCKVETVPLEELPKSLRDGFLRLTEALELDYAAADFKACPDGGALRFLEINNGPMFAAFDSASDGAVSDALIDHLLGTASSASS